MSHWNYYMPYIGPDTWKSLLQTTCSTIVSALLVDRRIIHLSKRWNPINSLWGPFVPQCSSKHLLNSLFMSHTALFSSVLKALIVLQPLSFQSPRFQDWFMQTWKAKYVTMAVRLLLFTTELQCFIDIIYHQTLAIPGLACRAFPYVVNKVLPHNVQNCLGCFSKTNLVFACRVTKLFVVGSTYWLLLVVFYHKGYFTFFQELEQVCKSGQAHYIFSCFTHNVRPMS